MGAEAGTSLLPNAALVAVGFLLGRVQLLPVAAQLLDELLALSPARKVRRVDYFRRRHRNHSIVPPAPHQAAITLSVLSLVVLYVLVFLLPLNWIAKKVCVSF